MRAAQGAYDVVITEDAGRPFDGLGARVRAMGGARAVVVTDARVGPLWGGVVLDALRADGVDVAQVVIDGSEVRKDRDAWWEIVDGLLGAGVDRRAVVVAVGGGVVGDLAGFAAAVTLRGLRWVMVPTTLLAMVDSSVGGKTGFNHPRGKNLVGAFHAPSLVWAALPTLSTLPARQRAAGLAEAVKTALIGGEDDLERLVRDAAALAAGDAAALAGVVDRCVAVKAAVVEADEREGGRRAVLNLGHTVGHAIEAVAGFGRIEHGEAVAIGLVTEVEATARAGWTVEPDLAGRLAALLGALDLPSTQPDDLPRSGLRAALRLDKKADGAMLRLPVVRAVGDVVVRAVPWADLEELLLP